MLQSLSYLPLTWGVRVVSIVDPVCYCSYIIQNIMTKNEVSEGEKI